MCSGDTHIHSSWDSLLTSGIQGRKQDQVHSIWCTLLIAVGRGGAVAHHPGRTRSIPSSRGSLWIGGKRISNLMGATPICMLMSFQSHFLGCDCITREGGALCRHPTHHLSGSTLPNGILSSAQSFIKEFPDATFQFASDLFNILMRCCC